MKSYLVLIIITGIVAIVIGMTTNKLFEQVNERMQERTSIIHKIK